MEIKITTRLISDRQDLLEDMKARQAGLDAYMYDRLDMFWIEVDIDGKTSTFAVDPRESGVPFSLSHQYGPRRKLDPKLAELAFSGSKEEIQQNQWMKALEEGGYFEDGQFPGKDTEHCPHCGRVFKIGSTHEHKRYEGKVVPHNERQYKKIKEAGFKISWRPGYSPDEPSLEDLGEIERKV